MALEWGTNYDIRVNGIAKEHEPLFKLGEKWDIAMAAMYLASKSLSMWNIYNFSLWKGDDDSYGEWPSHLAVKIACRDGF